MDEIVKINLDNEMDLILAHKRTMKLAELCGLSVPSQTTFATAVSEIARCAISKGENSYLILGINSRTAGKKEIAASVYNAIDLGKENSEALLYAKRLMGDLKSERKGENYEITLNHLINFSGTISEARIEGFKDHFRSEPPISPYDEIRKKNIQLIDLANKLQESEKQYRLLTDTLPLMMFSINQQGEVKYSNKWLKDYFSEATNQVSSVSWQNMIHPEDVKEIWSSWDSSQTEKSIFRAQGRLRDKNEKYLWHLITIVPLKNDRNVILNWMGFFVDINSQKLVEETLKDNKELKHAQKRLEEYQHKLEQKISELNTSNQNLEQFAFVASHDLQEPLRKIQTFSNLLQHELELSERHFDFFEKIKRASGRMSKLIRDVLNFSRLSITEELLSETDLNALVRAVLADFDVLIEEKKAKIDLQVLPVMRVIPLQMNQLFSNLIHNALKFSVDQPHISISFEEVSSKEKERIGKLEASRHYLCIRIKDNGIGFDNVYAERIFTIFQRLDTEKTSGTGIGLALCKKIAENHQGHITAESSINIGSVFSLYLPTDL